MIGNFISFLCMGVKFRLYFFETLQLELFLGLYRLARLQVLDCQLSCSGSVNLLSWVLLCDPLLFGYLLVTSHDIFLCCFAIVAIDNSFQRCLRTVRFSKALIGLKLLIQSGIAQGCFFLTVFDSVFVFVFHTLN